MASILKAIHCSKLPLGHQPSHPLPDSKKDKREKSSRQLLPPKEPFQESLSKTPLTTHWAGLSHIETCS